MKNVAIILAGGVGSRMNFKTPKQFLKIDGKEMIIYSLETFSKCKEISEIIIVSHEDYLNKCEKLVKENNFEKVAAVIPGGENRQASVLEGLKHTNKLYDECNVLIHDSARPFVTEEIILNNIKALAKHDCCTTALPSYDTVYEVNDEKVDKVLDRNVIYLAQTPQSAKLSLLLTAHKKAKKVFTDEASLLNSIGKKPHIVLGDISNKKITTKEDLKNL